MNILVIGDVHGCYHTFKNMLAKHWDHETEMLIQLGDIIDRGSHSPKMVVYARQLLEDYPNQVVFLKGNHEYEIIEHFFTEPNHNWLRQCGEETLRQYEAEKRDCLADVTWMKALPLFWKNDHVFISHAGISEAAADPFQEDSPSSVIWNRGPLKNINKLQIIGHTPCEEPTYDSESNTWNIDTAAAYSGYLTGVKISATGEILEFFKEPTDVRDKSDVETAVALRHEGKQQESNELLVKLVQEFPDEAYVQYQCAWSYDLLGKETEAIPHYEQAIELGLSGKDLEGAMLGLGSSYRTLGKYEKSKEVFQKAIELFPSNRALQVFYSMVLYNLNEHNAAMETLLTCLVETTSDEDILFCKRAIKFYADKLDTVWG